MWKDLLKIILVTLLPLVWVYFKAEYPEYPLTQEDWIAQLMWLIGGLIGGWKLRLVVARAKNLLGK